MSHYFHRGDEEPHECRPRPALLFPLLLGSAPPTLLFLKITPPPAFLLPPTAAVVVVESRLLLLLHHRCNCRPIGEREAGDKPSPSARRRK